MSEEYISEIHIEKKEKTPVLKMKGHLSAESGLKSKNACIWLILCYHTLLEYFTSRLPRENIICEVINIFFV